MMTARVSEVLPNGDLVLEGIREVEINGDRQIVVLTGVARAAGCRPGQRAAVAVDRPAAHSLLRQGLDERQPVAGLADSHPQQDVLR